MAEEKVKTADDVVTKDSVEAGTEVATAQSTDVAAADDEIDFDDMLLGDAGAGSENIGLEHLTVPFFGILQPLSPQAQKGGPEYIKGPPFAAEPGMIINTMTKRLYKANVGEEKHNGILVAAIHFEPKAIEWKPRGSGGGGGGLIRVWGDDNSYQNSPDYEFSKEKNRWISKEGNEVTDHYDTYIGQIGYFDEENNLVLENATGILSCKGSQIKKSKNWNAERMMRRIVVKGNSIQPPSWYGTYRVQTRFEQNDKGSWFGWDISPYKSILELDGGKAMYASFKKLNEQINAGDLKANEADRMAEAKTEGGSVSSGDIPF